MDCSICLNDWYRPWRGKSKPMILLWDLPLLLPLQSSDISRLAGLVLLCFAEESLTSAERFWMWKSCGCWRSCVRSGKFYPWFVPRKKRKLACEELYSKWLIQSQTIDESLIGRNFKIAADGAGNHPKHSSCSLISLTLNLNRSFNQSKCTLQQGCE